LIDLSQTWSVTAKRIGVGHVTLGWSEFMGEQNRGRCYQHDRVWTI